MNKILIIAFGPLFLFNISISFSQSVPHTYKLILIDEDRKPVLGATIEYELLDQFDSYRKEAISTDSTGTFFVSLPVTIKTFSPHERSVYSQLYYTINATGHFTEKGRLYSRFGTDISYAPDSVVTDTIALEPFTANQRYLFKVTDSHHKPLKAAAAMLRITNGRSTTDTMLTTDADGQASIAFQVQADDSSFRNRREYSSNLKYEISRQGFYSLDGAASSSYGSRNSFDICPETLHVQLMQPTDYLTVTFARSKQASAFKSNILKFIDLIRLEGLISDAILEYNSIEVINFKNNRYLRIRLRSTFTYNSIKLNDYDIGKKLFDEIIRKILNPLNTFIADPKSFFGYDISIQTEKKDFTKDYAVPRQMAYRFLMPQSVVRSYKNKDLSGQQLINKSIILLDDERIDLTLQ